MVEALHGKQTIYEGIHTIVAYEFADGYERDTTVVDERDIGKVARQTGVGLLILRSVDGYGVGTWDPLSGITYHGALLGLEEDDHPQYYRLDGYRPLSGDMDADGYIILNLSNPVNPQDAATKSYVDSHIISSAGLPVVLSIDNTTDGYDLEVSNGSVIRGEDTFNLVFQTTSGGNIVLDADGYIDAYGNIISNLATPVSSTDAVNKGYVDGYFAGLEHGALLGLTDDDHPQYILVDGTRDFTGTVGGITPTDPNHLTTKEYVDGYTAGLYDITGEPSGFPNTTDSTIAAVDGYRTFSIEPTGASYDFLVKGRIITKTGTDDVIWPDVEGIHYFYFDENYVLQTSQVTADWIDALIGNGATVAALYWDATNKDTILLAEERHGFMPGPTHVHFHLAFGAQWVSGGSPGNMSVDGSGNSNADAQMSFSTVVVRDEDLQFTWLDGNPQDLSPIAQIPIYWRSGASGYWRKKTADNFPMIYSGTAGYTGAGGRLPYNQFTGATWQLTEVTNAGFVLVHFFASDNVYEPVIGIQGQAQYSTVSAARAGANVEINTIQGTADLLSAEHAPLVTIILQTSSTYTNTPSARVRSTEEGDDYIDFRGNTRRGVGGVSGVADHGLLSGLMDDDHIQYLLVNGTRAMSGDLDMGDNSIITLADPVNPQDGVNKRYVDGYFAGLEHGDLLGLGDDDHTQYILVDGTRAFTGTVAGVDPASATDLVTKQYVDGYFAGLEHGDLLGLGDDDHTQYILVDGTRDFTGTIGGITPTDPDHLVTKQYVDGYFAGLEHGDLLGLADDDHTQYILVDGTRAFTGTVSGVTPTISTHLVTKGYVDGYFAGLEHGDLLGLADDDHTQYILVDGTRAFTGTVGGVTPTAPSHLTTKDYVDGYFAGYGLPEVLLVDNTSNGTDVVLNSGSALSIGATPASTGAIRLTNTEFIRSGTIGGSGTTLIGCDSSGRVQIGEFGEPWASQVVFRTGTGGLQVFCNDSAQFASYRDDRVVFDTPAGENSYIENIHSSAGASADFIISGFRGFYPAGDGYDGGDLILRGGDGSVSGSLDNGGDVIIYGGNGTNGGADGYIIFQRDGGEIARFNENNFLDVNANRIVDAQDPVDPQDVATKHYVDGYIASSNEWSEVLANGATSGGTNPIISTGDQIEGETNLIMVASDGYVSGGSIYMYAGDGPSQGGTFYLQSGQSASGNAGDIYLKAGVGAVKDGYIYIQRGTTTVATFDTDGTYQRLLLGSQLVELANFGGNTTDYIKTPDDAFVHLKISTGDSSNLPIGDVTIKSGDMLVSDSSNTGNVSLTSGTSTAGPSGNITIGSGASSENTSGAVSLTSGNAYSTTGALTIGTGTITNSGTVGNLTISTGDNPSGSSGVLSILGGESSDANGGVIYITGGDGYANSGFVSITSGDSSNGNAQNISITGGNGVTHAGGISINAGDATSDQGGSVDLFAGDAGNDSNGGPVNIAAGQSTSGPGGTVTITSGVGATYDGYVVIKRGGVEVARWNEFNQFDVSANRIVDVQDPVNAQDAVTKNYVDGYFAGLEHGDLLGLGDDDHTQYILVNGTRAFSGTVGGVTPTDPSHLTTKQYVDGYFAGLEHGDLLGLGDDDHTQYILVDGTRAFSGTVGGVTPTDASHLVTKAYVDGYFAGLEHGDLLGLGDDDHTQYILVNGTRDFTGTVGGVDPVSASDLATKNYVDGYIDSYLPLDGSRAMTGDLDLGSNDITNPGANTFSTIYTAATTGTRGDILYRDVDNWTVLAAGDDGYVLTTHGTTSDPTWESPGLPGLHATTHENGGSDEIDVTGLSGQLADAQPIKVRLNSVGDGYLEPRLNLIEGANISLTVDDDPGNNEVDITISTSGAVGEANIGANVGGGTGQVYRNKTGVTLNFKTINGSDGITITNNADTIDVDGYDLLPRDGSLPMIGDLDMDGYDILDAGEINGYRTYAASATNPSSPAPADGDRYFNTSLEMWMTYDGSRSKWLSEESAYIQFGRNGNTATGAYFRGVDGQAFSDVIGQHAFWNGTIVAASITIASTVTTNIQFTEDGTTRASLGLTASASERSTTLSGDFSAGGVLGVRNDAAGDTVDNCQGWYRVKWRV